jgi:RNA-directed DNA polymerase
VCSSDLELREQLLSGTYQPAAVKQQLVPKGNGGVRQLGIPTVLDRFIQQALLQVLQPMFDPDFSSHSHGFRPGKRAHDAIVEAQRYIQQGRKWVVDVDLAAFFDRVNHDVLMGKLSKRIEERRVLGLIRRYLNAGIMANGITTERHEGTPQGGPLSPLLWNLVLDELDRELERRGHRFVRYADDCNIYVRSEAAGHRVMASITRFIERRLKLQVNAEKSAVGRPWQRSFLGYTLREDSEFRRCVAEKALARFKSRVRELTRRSRGVSLERVVVDLNPFLRGRAGYFGLSQWRELSTLDAWVRRRLRCLAWVQWRTMRRRIAGLCRLGVAKSAAFAAARAAKGPWRLSASRALHNAFGKACFRAMGLVEMAGFVKA